jgi:hypothetical protein
VSVVLWALPYFELIQGAGKFSPLGAAQITQMGMCLIARKFLMTNEGAKNFQQQSLAAE